MHATWDSKREALKDYFDRTASETWAKLTSDAPVSRIRATVRAGRDEMRGTLLSWLPEDLSGKRLLDAGCGTGALAVEAARRGAEVVAIDVAESLVSVAAERAPAELSHLLDWRTGDMLSPGLGTFDYAVAMDSLIHYRRDDLVAALEALAPRVSQAMLITFAPRTPMLSAMHSAGKLFPRSDRSPAIVPMGETGLRRAVDAALPGWSCARGHRVHKGFYISTALEVRR